MPARRALAAGLAWLLLLPLMFPAGCWGGDVSTTFRAGDGATASSGPSTSGAEAVTDAVKVGALLPLSGDLAAQGQDSLRGLRLAAAEVNAAGGIHALGGASITLVEADSQGDPKIGADEAERLVREEGVAALIGTVQSTVALPVSEVAERLETPFIVSMAAADEITERDLKYTFRLWPKAEWYARDQVRFLGDPSSLGGLVVNKVALLYQEGTFGGETAAGQREYLEAAGIEVVKEISYSTKQADLHNEILAIKASGAQAVLTATYQSDALLIAKAVQAVRLGLPVLDSAGGMSDPGFIANAGSDAEGIYTELEYLPGTSAPGLDKAMTASAGEPLSAGALYAYQAMWLLADALERAGAVAADRLRSALATTWMPAAEHMVLPQAVLSFDGSGQNRGARLLVAQIQDGRYVPIWPAEYRRAAPRLP